MMGIEQSPWHGVQMVGGRYRNLVAMGDGGMAHVYRAYDVNLQTAVVIKSPRRTHFESPQQIARFEEEVKALINLSFPHIVPIIDVGRHDGMPFVVMRFLSGGSLFSHIKRDADQNLLPMPSGSLKYWLPSIAKALDFVHGQHYLHRDVKPSNILFDQHRQAYLSDFGVIKVLNGATTQASRQTAAGFVLGTVEYLAPELLSESKCDGRADQYALAVTLYEVLAGRLPFAADTLTAWVAAHLNDAPVPLHLVAHDLPAALCAAVMRGLSKNPQDRFPNCAELARAVLRVAALPVTAAAHADAADGTTARANETPPSTSYVAENVDAATTPVRSAQRTTDVVPTSAASISANERSADNAVTSVIRTRKNPIAGGPQIGNFSRSCDSDHVRVRGEPGDLF